MKLLLSPDNLKSTVNRNGKLTDPYNSTDLHRVIHFRFLTRSTFILRITRENLQFRAGQRILVGVAGDMDQRDYSVYSGENDDYIEILVREVTDGKISVKLKESKPGDHLTLNGPFGSFGPDASDRYSRELIFIATGTGISPFHSIIRSYPGINYRLFHGVRFVEEAYEKNEYHADRYVLCTSQEKYSGRKGRVTSLLSAFTVTDNMSFYLCGNSSMIYEASHILGDKGVPPGNISSEIYF